MIIDNTNERLDEIKTFANKNNMLESFNESFSWLENYSDRGFTVNLYSDFAPLSMEFSIKGNDRLILYGGFIFHGAHDGFGSGIALTFSVCIDPDNKAGWSIHT